MIKGNFPNNSQYCFDFLKLRSMEYRIINWEQLRTIENNWEDNHWEFGSGKMKNHYRSQMQENIIK